MDKEFFDRHLSFLTKLKEMVEDEIYFMQNFNPAKEKAKFPVGAIVRIKSWDKMVKEYGLNDFGEINCCEGFVPNMKKFCGLKVTITDVSFCSNGKSIEYFITTAPDPTVSPTKREYLNEELGLWTFTEDMFEYYDGK